MIKRVTILTICLLAGAAIKSHAQSSASASQTIHLQIYPVIVIGNGGIKVKTNNGNHGNGNNGNGNGNNGNNGNGNNGNGNGNGNGNNKVANNNNDNGTRNSEFVVSSNKEFMVSIKSEGDNDVYVAIADNNTGGNVTSKFKTNYTPIATTSQDLLTNCARGDEQRFSVNYMAKRPAKKTQVITKSDIIYTATLP